MTDWEETREEAVNDFSLAIVTLDIDPDTAAFVE